MHIGGWTRIGVILAALYGLLVGVVAYDTRPNIQHKYEAWFEEAARVIADALTTDPRFTNPRPEEVRKYLLDKDNEQNAAWLDKVAVTPSEAQKNFSGPVGEVNAKHKAKIAAFPEEQLRYWLFALLWWAAGVALMFTLGWTTRWVYRGFRPPAA